MTQLSDTKVGIQSGFISMSASSQEPLSFVSLGIECSVYFAGKVYITF